MKMQGNSLVRFAGVMVCVGMIMVSGCGKNVVGPTAPQAVSATDTDVDGMLSLASPATDQMLNAACARTPTSNRGLIQSLLSRITYQFLFQQVSDLNEGYFTDPAVKQTVKDLIKSKLFRIVLFKTGLGQKIMCQALEILTQTWAPGDHTTPNGFESPEVTLLPYKYSPGGGFYGDRLTGWANGTGYNFYSLGSAGEVLISTSTDNGNMYLNQGMLKSFRWSYTYYTLSGNSDDSNKNLNVNLYYDSALQHLQVFHPFNGTPSSRITIGGVTLFFDQSWMSVQDRSVHANFFSTDGRIKFLLDTHADGTGQGSLDIENSAGGSDHFEFVLTGYDDGYWTKNGGRPIRF